MTLSLVDQAAPQVKSLIGLFGQLEGAVNSLSARLTNAVKGIAGIDDAGAGAAGIIERLNLAATSAAAGLERMTAATVQSAEGLLAHSSASAKAEAGMLATGTAAETAAGRMATARGEMAGLTGQASVLGSTLKGLAELWAAFEIKKGLTASVDEASQFQQLEARLKALNRPEAENKQFIDSARASSQKLGFVSLNEAIEARLAAVAGLGRNDAAEIDKTINEALKTAIIFKLRGDRSDVKDIVRNLYGVAEMRGQTSDPDAMNKTFDLLQRIDTAAQGKLSIKDMETVFRQLKYGGGAMVDDQGIALIMAFANQLKAAGIGGGGGSGGSGVTQAGTAVTQVLKWAEGGLQNKEQVRLLTAMGLLDSSQIRRSESSTTDVNVGPGALRDSALAARNPIGWLMAMAPVMLKFVQENRKQFFGDKDINDPKAQDEALTKLAIMLTSARGGVNVGNMIAQAILPGPSSRLLEEQKLTAGAKPTDAALSDLQQTYGLQVEKFDAAVHNLAQSIGMVLLPVLTPIIEKFGEWIRDLAQFSTDHPIIAFIGAMAAGLTGILALLASFGAGLGVILRFAGVVTEGSAAAAAGAGVFSRLGTVITGLGGILARWIPVVGAFFLGWDFGKLLGSINIGAQSIEERVSRWIENVVNIIHDGWVRASGWLAALTGGSTTTGAGARSASGKISGAPMAVTTFSDARFDASRAPAETPEQRRRREMLEAGSGISVGGVPDKPITGHRIREQSDIPALENELKAEQDDYNKRMLMQGSFETWSLQQTRDYWAAVLQASTLSAKDRQAAENKYYDAERQLQVQSFNAYIASLEAQIAAAGHHIEQKIALAEKEYQAEVQRYGQLSVQAQNAYKKIAQYRKELADQNARVAEIEGTMEVAKFKHATQMGKLQADQDLAMRRISNEQRLQIEQQYLDQEYQQARAAQEKLMADVAPGAPNADPVKYAELKRQLLTIDQDYETKKTQLIQQQERDRAQAAIDAANSVQNAFSGFFNDLASGKGFKASLQNLGKSIESSLTKIASDQLSKQLFGPGTTGGGFLNSIFGKMFGVDTGSKDPSVALSGAGTTLNTAGSQLNIAAQQLQAAANSLSMKGGGIDGGFGLPGLGGFDTGPTPMSDFGLGSDFAGAGDFAGSMFGMPGFAFGGGFAKGIDYVPRDMLAVIHEGERVVPKAMNRPDFGAAPQMPPMTFNFHGPVDTRSRSQVAAGVYDGMRMYATRIRK